DLQGYLAAQGRGHEWNGDVGCVLALWFGLAAAAPAFTLAAKNALEIREAARIAAAKDMAKHLRRLGRVHFLLGARATAPIELKVARTPSPAKAGIGAGFAEAVILAALGLIAQNVVGRLSFFEASLGWLVARAAVRGILPGAHTNSS